MTYTPEQRKAIAMELTKLLAADNTTPIPALLRQAVDNLTKETK